MPTLSRHDSRRDGTKNMTQSDLDQIEELIKKHKSSGSSGCGTIILVLFILGFFKGCGY